jgi:phospholipase/carboxylesterase
MLIAMPLTRRALLAAGLGALLRTQPARGQELTPGQYPLDLDKIRDGVLYLPRSYKPGVPMPLIVLFHGAGGSGLTTQYSWPMADEFGFIVLAPDSRDERTWDLVLGQYGPDVEFLMEAFRLVLSKCAVDRQHLTVAGHSDGASYSLSFGITNGDVFNKVIALSPGVLQPADARGKPKVFISHGTNDRTMPIDDTSRKFVPRLKGLGYDVTYREYEGGHGAPREIVHEAYEWWKRN